MGMMWLSSVSGVVDVIFQGMLERMVEDSKYRTICLAWCTLVYMCGSMVSMTIFWHLHEDSHHLQAFLLGTIVLGLACVGGLVWLILYGISSATARVQNRPALQQSSILVSAPGYPKRFFQHTKIVHTDTTLLPGCNHKNRRPFPHTICIPPGVSETHPLHRDRARSEV